MAMVDETAQVEQTESPIVEEEGHEHSGGGRFNRRLYYVVLGVLITVGVVGVHGIRSAGEKVASTVAPPLTDNNTVDVERHKAEVAEMAADGATTPAPMALPTPGAVAVIPIPRAQTPLARAPRTPSRYAQWAEDKYMRALEAPQMVGAFHSGGTLELGSARGGQGGNADATANEAGSPNVTLQPPASPYMVMAGSVIPAVLVSGIDSDLPGPILAQVSQNVFDSATGQRLLIPQGSRLIGNSQSAGGYGQAARSDRVATHHLSRHLEYAIAADAGSGSKRHQWLHRSGQQSLSRDLRHGCSDESHQCGADGRPDGGLRWRRDLRTVRLLPTESVGDGRPDRRVRGFGTVGRPRPTDDEPWHEPAADDRHSAGLRIQRDGDRGPGLPGSLQGLNETHEVSLCLHIVNRNPVERRSETMGLLKRKEEKTQTISVRVPASVKAELDELRRQADAAGFDLTATLTEVLVRMAKQVRAELEDLARKANGNRATKVNGLANHREEHGERV